MRVLLAGALLLAASPASGQTFKGSGTRATEGFPLVAGVTVFEVEHKGDGLFRIQLLDEQGATIEQVATATGVFGGSKAVRIPALGRYLLNVEASGSWSIRIRTGAAALDPGLDPATRSAFQEGRDAGAAAAARPGTGGWFGRGFVGGLVLGPVGALIMGSGATRSAERAAEDATAALAPDRLDYTAGFREAYAERLGERRGRAALIGGIVGTGILAAVLIQVVVLSEGGEVIGGPGSDPPRTILSIPLPVLR